MYESQGKENKVKDRITDPKAGGHCILETTGWQMMVRRPNTVQWLFL